MTAAEAIDQLRQQAPDQETIYYIYVLDDAAGGRTASLAPRRLLGVISLRDLILAPRHALVRELMETDLVTLRYDEDAEAVAQLFARYDFIAAPVVDDKFGLLGIVTHDDVLDVVTREATEDLQRQGGRRPDRGELPGSGVLERLVQPGEVAGGAVHAPDVHDQRDGVVRGRTRSGSRS